MYDVHRDLHELLESHGVAISPVYRTLSGDALTEQLSYATDAMYGLAATLLSSPRMVAHNLVQNSIDEAKGAARIKVIAERYAPPDLAAKMFRHVRDEMRHSSQFMSLLEITGRRCIADSVANAASAEVRKVLDFDDELRAFICRVHSIE